MNEKQEVHFLFLSQVLGRKVRDSEGKAFGRVHDLSAVMGEIYPVVQSLVIRSRGWRRPLLVAPCKDVEILCLPQKSDIVLKVSRTALSSPPPPSENEFLLRKELLDNQIVDTRGRKVVRVNDVHLMLNNGEVRIVHVDVGMRGLFRSLGWERIVDWLVRFFSPRARYLTQEHFVSWKYVQPVSASTLKRGLLKLSVTQRKLTHLHPADFAEIMNDLDTQQRSALFQSFDIGTAADTLSESHPRVQRDLLDTVGAEKAADILEEMPPDKAADLLADLPSEEASELLTKMKHDEAKEVSELLSYPEDTAGGLMTTEFIASSRESVVKDLMEKIRGGARAETVYYIFVTEGDNYLVGVVTLKDLLLSHSEQRVGEIMVENPVSIHPDEGIKGMIELFTKYKLLALPVVDAEGRIKGIVTMDDIMAHVVGQKRKT